MEDFNAKIGSDNRTYKETMGQQGIREMNENGEGFADLCNRSDLVVGWRYRRIHKTTWMLPDLQTENQDHMCIEKRFRRPFHDVRVKRGADVASDHHLLVARLKVKPRRNRTGRTNQRLGHNTFLLHDIPNDITKQEDFSITLYNKFQPCKS